MAIDKATYWLAVGVLALGLNSTFQNQEVQWAQNVAGQARLTAEGLAQRGLGYLVMAEVMFGANPAGSPRLQAALARLQVKTAEAQAALASREASRELRDAQRVNREFNRRQLAYVAEDLNACPHRGMVHVPTVHIPKVDVHVPGVRVPNIDVRVPEVRVPDVHVDVEPVLHQVQNLSYLKSMQHYRAFESLKNLPTSSDFDFSEMPSMTIPRAGVHLEIHHDSRDTGPI